jgi:hypothetical protein
MRKNSLRFSIGASLVGACFAAAWLGCNSIAGIQDGVLATSEAGGDSEPPTPDGGGDSPQMGPEGSVDADADAGTRSEASDCGAAGCDSGPASCMPGYTMCTSGGTTTCVDESNDPNNCGACGRQCGTGAQCNAKLCTPTTVLSGSPLGTSQSLACDANNVYWVNKPSTGLATVYQVPIAGGSALPLSNTSPTGDAVGVALNGTMVGYTLDLGGEQVQLYTATAGSANSATLFVIMCYGFVPGALTYLGGSFYGECLSNGSTGYNVAQADLADASSATNVYSVSTGLPGNTITTASNTVFWTDNGGDVMYYTQGASGTNPAVYGETSPTNLATDGSNLFWVAGTAMSAQLRKAPAHPAFQTATTVATVSGNTWSGLQTIASNGTNVYWADTSGGKPGIYTVPVGGGTAVLRAASLGVVPSTLAVCGSKLVWFEGNTTPVLRAMQLP